MNHELALLKLEISNKIKIQAQKQLEILIFKVFAELVVDAM